MAKLPNYYKIHTDGHDVALEPIYEELVPVVHGRWVFVEVPSLSWYGHKPGWYCSQCGWKVEDKSRNPKPPALKHCPNCTARMDGDKE